MVRVRTRLVVARVWDAKALEREEKGAVAPGRKRKRVDAGDGPQKAGKTTTMMMAPHRRRQGLAQRLAGIEVVPESGPSVVAFRRANAAAALDGAIKQELGEVDAAVNANGRRIWTLEKCGLLVLRTPREHDAAVRRAVEGAAWREGSRRVRCQIVHVASSIRQCERALLRYFVDHADCPGLAKASRHELHAFAALESSSKI